MFGIKIQIDNVETKQTLNDMKAAIQVSRNAFAIANAKRQVRKYESAKRLLECIEDPK